MSDEADNPFDSDPWAVLPEPEDPRPVSRAPVAAGAPRVLVECCTFKGELLWRLVDPAPTTGPGPQFEMSDAFIDVLLERLRGLVNTGADEYRRRSRAIVREWLEGR